MIEFINAKHLHVRATDERAKYVNNCAKKIKELMNNCANEGEFELKLVDIYLYKEVVEQLIRDGYTIIGDGSGATSITWRNP